VNIKKWLVGLPCHHPAWPRYCNECGVLAAGCIVTKTLRPRQEARVEEKIRQEGGNYFRDAVMVEAVPALIVKFAITACLPCRTLFVAKEDYTNDNANGLLSVVRRHFEMRVIRVDSYETRPQHESLPTVRGDGSP
jgi:hypothetical protein